MSHSRSKGNRPQQQRQQESSQEWNRSRTSSPRNEEGEGSGSQNYREQFDREQERYGGGGYGGSQGMYGRDGGYRGMNFADRFGNPRGESEYQGPRENRGDSRYGQQDWRSPESNWESGNRWEGDRSQQYRQSQPEQTYRQQWGNDHETENRSRGGWEGVMESGRGQERQRSNVTRISHRGGMQQDRGMPGASGGSGIGQQRQSFAGRGPQGYKRSDERITEDINEELTQDAELDAAEVSVEVKEGEVTLKGTVSDRESKRRAEEIAESCSGVKEVLNQIRIKRDSSSREDSSGSESMSRRDKSDDKRNKVAS